MVLRYVRRYAITGLREKKALFSGEDASEYNKLHSKDGLRVPIMGGLIMGLVVLICSMVAAFFFPFHNIDFVVIYAIWFFGFILGYLFDYKTLINKEIRVYWRIVIIAVVTIAISILMNFTLGIDSLYIPFYGDVFLGHLIAIPILLVFISLFLSGIIDGIDGLTSSIFSVAFLAYGIIAAFLGLWSVVLFCVIMMTAIAVYLWRNITPARWYMGDTGVVSLSFALGAIAFITDSYSGGIGVSLLPLIVIMLVVTVVTTIIQMVNKRMYGKKIWLSTPIHHHFEAIGMPSQSVVFRYALVAFFFATFGVLIFISII